MSEFMLVAFLNVRKQCCARKRATTQQYIWFGCTFVLMSGLPPFMQKFGIYERVDHNLPVSVMCDRAVMALDKIKTVYKQRVKVYDESLRSRALKSQQILENMEEAITKHQFQVWYQPKHNIQTGKLVGAEALVRWIHPKYGFMSPADFVPLFFRVRCSNIGASE